MCKTEEQTLTPWDLIVVTDKRGDHRGGIEFDFAPYEISESAQQAWNNWLGAMHTHNQEVIITSAERFHTLLGFNPATVVQTMAELEQQYLVVNQVNPETSQWFRLLRELSSR